MSEICPQCNAPFGSAADLVEHTRTGHAAEPVTPDERTGSTAGPWLRCALCGARFRSPLELAAHNSQPHPSRRYVPWPGPSPI